MRSVTQLGRIRIWRKRALGSVFVAWLGIGPIAVATCVAQTPIGSADQLSTPSKDTTPTPVVIVDAKKCEDKAPTEPDVWSGPERWAWQQICKHLNVDFDELEANDITDKEAVEGPRSHDEIYNEKLEKLHKQHDEKPEELAKDAKRRLSGKFLAMIFGDADKRVHTWAVPLKFFGFNTDQFVIDTAALNSLDIRYAYVPKFLIQNATVQRDLRFEHTHSESIKLNFVTTENFMLNNVWVIAKNLGPNYPMRHVRPTNAGERDGALDVDTARIEDRLSIWSGYFDAIKLKRVKVGDLFIDRPTWNNPGGSGPELSISESVDDGIFHFQPDSEGVKRIRLNQFIFANAYFGANPMPVIHAMDADASTGNTSPDLEPYTLIAKAYAQRGETSISDRVLAAKNNQDWRLADRMSWSFLSLTFTWLFAGYGFHPEVGFLWIGGFVLVGWAVFRYASGSLAEGSYQPKSPLLLALDLHSAGRRANIGVISWAHWRLFGHFRLKN
jgi:hypothetical protein